MRVFLAGSIDMGDAPDWQADIILSLAGTDADILNPRRADWQPHWQPIAADVDFRRQVEWELAALESADIIAMHLSPGSRSPISLMEFGLHARSGKLIVVCPEGYWRKGNIDIAGERYGVLQVNNITALTAAVRERIDHDNSSGRAATALPNKDAAGRRID